MRRLLMHGNAFKRLSSVTYRSIGSEPLLLGNKAIVRDSDAFKTVWTDFVGTFREGKRNRIAGGDMLYFLDTCGGCSAARFISGNECDYRMLHKWNPELTLSTVSFNSFVFRRPVFQGDLVVVTGSVVHAGRSSVGVHLEVSRQGYDSQSLDNVGECFLTVVCISAKDLSKPVKDVIPGVQIASELGKSRHAAYMNIRALRDPKINAEKVGNDFPILEPEALDDCINKYKPCKVSIADTVTSGVRMFRPVDMNVNNAIYGGEILRWMEEHARHCARMFAGSPHMHTIAMYDMMFDHPIYVSDTTTLTAKVVYVRHTTLEVAVETRVERSGKLVTSNRAFFVLICVDGESNKIMIPKGIDLHRCTREHLLEYAKAKQRYEGGLKTKLKLMHSETPSSA